MEIRESIKDLVFRPKVDGLLGEYVCKLQMGQDKVFTLAWGSCPFFWGPSC